MDFGDSSSLVLVLAVVAAALALFALRVVVRAWLRRARIHARLERAYDGESRAREWLEDAGYVIVGAQVSGSYVVTIDGEAIAIGVRADYVVERRGRRFVAEVKTGAEATRIETTATRRQLLEYQIAFDCDGVLLIDANEGRIHTVTFPLFTSPRAEKRRRSA